MEFFDWNNLGSYAGAALAVAVLTQITKGIPGVSRIPTQLWSYLLSFVTLALSNVFGGSFEPRNLVLAVFNAAIVSLAANGGFEAVNRLKEGLTARSAA